MRHGFIPRIGHGVVAVAIVVVGVACVAVGVLACLVAAAGLAGVRGGQAVWVWAVRASQLEANRRTRSPQRHLPFVWLGDRDGFTHLADQKNLDVRTIPALKKSAELVEGEARFV